MPKIHKQTTKNNGKEYEYQTIHIVLRADEEPMKQAIKEMDKLHMNAPSYFRMLMWERIDAKKKTK